MDSLVDRANNGNVESRQSELVAVQIFLICLSLSSYIIRVYARAYMTKTYGTDDILMGIAMIFNIGLTVDSCVAARFGWGLHRIDVPLEDADGMLLVVWIAELLFTLTSSFVKLSILYFYLRIAITKTYRRLIYASIIFIVIWAVTFTFAIIFQCNPISSYWHFGATQCVALTAPLVVHGITSILTDIYIFVLPQPMLWKLQIPRNQKIGIFVLFGIGFIDCVAGTIRLYISAISYSSDDKTWVGYYFWTSQAVEVNIAIFLASLPSFKKIYTKYYPTQGTRTRTIQTIYVTGDSKSNGSRRVCDGSGIDMGSSTFKHHRADDRAYKLGPMTSVSRVRSDADLYCESQENLTVTPIIVGKSSDDKE